jgi:outer membrane protein TolC
MNEPLFFRIVLGLGLISGWARAEPLAESQVVAETLGHNPAYAAQAAQLAQAVASLHSAEARYDPTLTLDAGVTRSKNPSLSVSGTLTSTQTLFSANAALRKQLIGGAQFTFSLGTSWQQAQTPFASNGAGTAISTSTVATTGPGYGLVAKAAVSLPLLRGSGTEVGLAAQREAEGTRTATAATRDRSASELVRDTMTAYWELWYATTAVTIQRQARDTARRQRDEAAARRDTGSAAPADVFSFETSLSQAEELLVQAEADERARAAELGRLLGRRTSTDLTASTEPPAPAALDGDLTAEVLAHSPEIAERRADVDLATVRARTAADSFRPRLDLDAYAQAQGLGNRDAGAAVGQFAGLDAVSLYVGLTYELPLQDRRRQAESERAQQSIVIARQSLESTRQKLIADLDTRQEKASSSRRRIDLAGATLAVARASLLAEQERFRTGSSTPLAVIQAQDQVRAADLRLARARVDLAAAHLGLLHVTGRLLSSVRPTD